MVKEKLESILKEEWLESVSWNSKELENQKRFHLALQKAYKELNMVPSSDDFICIINGIVKDTSKSSDVVEFAKKAELMFNYYKIVS